MEHTAEQMMQQLAARADILTATDGVNYVLVSPIADPRILCVIAEMWYVLGPDQFVLLHSGRTPREA